MSKKYNDIVHDEVMYWFDLLQENSIENISKITGIHYDKIRKILDSRYKPNKPFQNTKN